MPTAAAATTSVSHVSSPVKDSPGKKNPPVKFRFWRGLTRGVHKRDTIFANLLLLLLAIAKFLAINGRAVIHFWSHLFTE